MQKLLDFSPKAPEKLGGVNMINQLVGMLQSAVTQRSGSAKPSDIVDGELWCKELADGSREFYVWQEKDGAGSGTFLQDYFKVDAVSSDEEKADEHKFPTDKAVAKAFAEIKKNIVFYRSGDFIVSFESSKDGFLLCDGSAVSRVTYAALFAVIGTTFGAGDGSTTFNLPDFRGRFIQGAVQGEGGDLGSYKEAGLPNITGDLVTSGTWSGFSSASGALRKADGTGGYPGSGGKGGSISARIIFNASYSNSVYGKSNTVQPSAVALNVFIKY